MLWCTSVFGRHHKGGEKMKQEKRTIDLIYAEVAKKTLKMIRKEKATKLSRQTLKMIALTRELLISTRV